MKKDIIKLILNKQLEENRLFFPFINDLNGRESLVLKLRGEGKTLEEIGDRLYITRERIRQIEVKAKDKQEHKKKAMEVLTDALADGLFEESEIGEAFESFLPNGLTQAERSLEWLKLSKKLWELKRKK
jgi:transcriptional regulator